jgi:hypothetical protein
MSRFANLADKPKHDATAQLQSGSIVGTISTSSTGTNGPSSPPPSRVGRKAISAYFSPEMSLAMHVCARKHGLSLQALMAEAFDDLLRKYGESPIGG